MAPSYRTSSLDEENILAAVLQLGLGGTGMFIDQKYHGGQCCIYKLSFYPDLEGRDQESLAVRMPLYMSDDEGKLCVLKTEWQTLQELQRRGFAWSPKPLGCSLTFDNPVKHPFLVLTWAKGTNAHWHDNFPSRPVRDAFLKQLAMIQLSLLACTLDISSVTWYEFFHRVIRNRRTRVLSGKLPDLSMKDCDDQEVLLASVAQECQTGFTQREVAMDHGDIKPDNIIVDDKYNITW
ncbi:hypothetical protein S7711_10779 [Stachybotrys chartarum IBT 7711]|uniref:Aminoglycoside phosphotransferase domain-containing protein n=1 Tax=Stachybotrys chartarum (strain CBS 109288 / IBT 7711) TaxID=1280523 RepID=A0A084AHS9_STACB|nr:hypothetical protein S7711_10779 [Stachybotrys chartarum IBT 7711]